MLRTNYGLNKQFALTEEYQGHLNCIQTEVIEVFPWCKINACATHIEHTFNYCAICKRSICHKMYVIKGNTRNLIICKTVPMIS